MKNQADYSQYECPYSHIEKDCGHELNGPEGWENTFGVWCACGYRAPVFCLDPEELKLKKKVDIKDFWNEREYNKNQHRNALTDLIEIKETQTFSDEEKIFLGQAIFWLKYLESRHYVSDEKFLKKFPKS